MDHKKTYFHLTGRFNHLWMFYLLIVISGFFSPGRVMADVSIVGSQQEPQNEVIFGAEVSYTLIIRNTTSEANDVSFRITSEEGMMSEDFTSVGGDCSLVNLGTIPPFFACGTLNGGSEKAFIFSWTPPVLGTHNLSFNVSCSAEGSCNGDTEPLQTIVRQLQPGNLQFNAATYQAAEGTTAAITVTRTGGSDSTLGAEIVIGHSEGDTADRADYTPPASTLVTFAPGVTEQTVLIPLIADSLVEGDEILSLDLVGGEGVVVGDPSQAVLTITDNAPLADRVDIVSGGRQNGEADTTLDPFVVKVLDSSGNVIEGALVAWTITPATGGSLSAGAETSTDALGETSNSLTLNTNEKVIVTARAAQGDDQAAIFIVNGTFIDTPKLTGNQKKVAAALDTACAALGSMEGLTSGENDLLDTCNKMATATPADIAEGLNRMAPDEIASQATSAIKTADIQVTNVNSRLNALRSGVKGMSLSGLNLNVRGAAIPGSVLNAMLDGEIRGGSAGDEADSNTPWGGFINGEISFGDKDDTDYEPGFDFDSVGITVGVDYRISTEVVVGGAIGYGTSDSDFNDDASSMEMKGWHLTGYGTYYRTDNFYIDGLVRLGRNTYDTSRRINLPGDPLQKAEGDTDSFEYSFSLNGGYEYYREALTLGGYGRLGYSKVNIDGYTESASNPGAPGSGSVLKLDDQDVDSLTITFGGEISYAISTSKAVFMPQLRLEWEHEFSDNERAIDAQFIHDPNSTTFGVSTDEPDRDYFNVGLGLSVITEGGKSGFLYYETRLDQDNIEQHWIKGGLRLEF